MSEATGWRWSTCSVAIPAANVVVHTQGPEDFLPKVIDSIRSSMSKSSVFGPAASRPEPDATAADAEAAEPRLGWTFGLPTAHPSAPESDHAGSSHLLGLASGTGMTIRARGRRARTLGTD